MRQLPFDINDKIKQDLQTIGNNADPKMQVVVARAKSSIQDSSYFTVENIRTKAGLTDISVATRRQKSYGPPDGLFAIHLDNGVAKVLERAYPDKLKLKWQESFQLGSAKSVAISFNGQWERYRTYWQLVTENYPYIFWVEGDGKLYTQKWNAINTKFLLATNVNKVKAVRGWKNVNFMDKDDGLIVGYIKTDGKLYYRNLTDTNGGLEWENERQIENFLGTAINLNMFITNDYRTAFIIEDTLGKIHWIITARNWAGMAIAPEKFDLRAQAEIDLISVIYHKLLNDHVFTIKADSDISYLFGRTDNDILNVKNTPTTRINEDLEQYQDYGFIIEFELKYPSVLPPIITVQDVQTLGYYAVAEVQEIKTEKIKYNIEDRRVYQVVIDSQINEFGFNIAKGDLIINIKGTGNPAGYSYNDMNAQFIPTDLIFPDLPIPEVEEVWNE